MVEEEAGAVRNATLASVEQLKDSSGAMHADVKISSAVLQRIDEKTKTIVVDTGRLHQEVDGKIPPISHITLF